MLQSKLFSKTRKEVPADEVSKNAQLLIKAGYIHKEMAGAYDYLPLGFKVLENIKAIIAEEMNRIGGQELIMTALQRKEVWEKTDRWSDQNVDVWFKSKLKNDTEVGFGWSHEEPITDMLKSHIVSFRDLPVCVYQFQTKLRNELRAKSGIMRGREFLMKDLYSYAADEKSHEVFYQQVIKSYMNIFKKVGIGKDTFLTFASGGAFTSFSHEFQTITAGGEDAIYINRKKNIAINEEILNEESLAKLGVKKEELEKVETSEVGNIFNFGTKKSEQLGLLYTSSDGKQIPVWMGSYGIGITRLMGVIAEKCSDEKGIIWPVSVAPFLVHLISLESGKKKQADKIYEDLKKNNIPVLYDDRGNKTAGEKFAESDLLGIPFRIVVSEKTLAKKSVEIKKRSESKVQLIKIAQLLKFLKKI